MSSVPGRMTIPPGFALNAQGEYQYNPVTAGQYTPPEGARQNELGYWVMPDGNFAPGQMTPGRQSNPGGELYFDPERGLVYTKGPNGTRSYQSPVAWGNEAPSGGGGLIHGNQQWNSQTGNWDTPIDWGKILSYGVGAALTGGTLSALMGGAAAPTAGAGLSEAAIPTASGITSAALPGGLTAATLASEGAGLGVAPLASHAIAPTAGMMPAGMTGASGGSAAGGLGSFLNNNRNVLGAALGAGAGLLGRALTPQRNTQVPIPPELQQLLTEATRRQMNQGPLSDAITQQALAGLPNYARK